MKIHRELAISFISLLFGSCTGNNKFIELNANTCTIRSIDTGFYISKIVTFSNNAAINEKEISVSDNGKKQNAINICNILELNKIALAEINTIAVLIQKETNTTEQFEIHYDQLRLIGKDTLITIGQSIE